MNVSESILALAVAVPLGASLAIAAPAASAPQDQGKPVAPSLLSAVKRGDVATVQALIAWGADPNESRVQRNSLAGFVSESPLLSAVERNDEPMVRVLLSAGAHARWRDASGRTLADVGRSRGGKESLIDMLTAAEQREFSLVPDWPLPEPLALVALRNIAATYGDPAARQRLDPKLLEQIERSVDVLARRWPAPLRDRPPALAWSLTRDVNSLEWAIQSGNNGLLAAVVADLGTKRQDCESSPDGTFGEVKVSVRTLLPDGSERRGLLIRYIERFYWDLRATVPAVAKQWKEFASTTAVVGEPLPAGDYVIIARSADGKDLSQERFISVSRNRSLQFDVPLR